MDEDAIAYVSQLCLPRHVGTVKNTLRRILAGIILTLDG